jgi:hypothetical protein
MAPGRRRIVLATLLMFAMWGGPVTAGSSEPRCIVPDSGTGEPSAQEVAGHYQSVSESEWSLEIWLHSNHKAEILRETWDAGQYDRRTSTRYRGSWSLSGSFVELSYAGRCETLLFRPALSFDEFGGKGQAPGLQGKYSSLSFNLFIGVSLWRAELLKNEPQKSR